MAGGRAQRAGKLVAALERMARAARGQESGRARRSRATGSTRRSNRRRDGMCLPRRRRQSRGDPGRNQPSRRWRATNVTGKRDQREQRRFQRIEIRRHQEPSPYCRHQRRGSGERPRADPACDDQRHEHDCDAGDERRPSHHHQLLAEHLEQRGDRVIRERCDDGEEVAVDQIAAQDAQRLCGSRSFIEEVGAAIEILQPIPRRGGEDDCGADPLDASAAKPSRKTRHDRG